MTQKKKSKSNGGGGVDLKDRNEEKSKLTPPKKYNVVFYNDDYTPMEFVWLVLMMFFGHNEATAWKIMMDVHENGKGIAGTYKKEIADMKVKKSMGLAKESQHPLLVQAEEV